MVIFRFILDIHIYIYILFKNINKFIFKKLVVCVDIYDIIIERKNAYNMTTKMKDSCDYKMNLNERNFFRIFSGIFETRILLPRRIKILKRKINFNEFVSVSFLHVK